MSLFLARMKSLFLARMKRFQSTMKALEWSQHFTHCKSIGIFFRRSRAANSVVHGPIWQNFETIRDFMVVLVSCKNEEDPIKKQGARVFTALYINFSDAQGQITPESVVVSGHNLDSSKLSCNSLSPARMKMIQSKMKELEWSQHFPHYKCMGIFQDGQGQLTPQLFVRSGRILNSFEMLRLSSLPVRMKRIESKMKALEGTRFSPL